MKLLVIIILILFNISYIIAQDSNTQTNKAEVSWIRETFSNNLSWEEMLSVVNSPEDISRRIHTRVDYTTNTTDNATTGKNIWDIRKGNCLGIAKAVNDACKAKGYLSRIEIYFTPGKPSSHAIVIGVYKDRLWICDNGSFQYVKSKLEIARIMRREHISHGTIYSDRYDEKDEYKLKIADE